MKALILAACLSLGACAGTPFTYDGARAIKPAMTEAQVTEQLGRPYQVVSRNGQQLWIWSYGNALGGARVVSFLMADGKVQEVPTIPESFR